LSGAIFHIRLLIEFLFIFKSKKFIKLLEVLYLCHTVQIDNNAKEKYQASSPDEYSFIKFCIKLGIIYEGEDKDPDSSAMIRKILYKDQTLKYKVLQVLEFDSTRKRMSVIVEDVQTNEVILFCKGAEVNVFPCCSKGDIQSCKDVIDEFARKGWRTLALAYKPLSKIEYASLEKKLTKASNDVTKREYKLRKIFNKIESNLKLIGATAVEDKLQENVSETLESLREAGIKIWVLTGDKMETAVNISHSCKHFSDEMIKLPITGLKKADEVKARIRLLEKE
jgi:phospholipid-translocating ATPase